MFAGKNYHSKRRIDYEDDFFDCSAKADSGVAGYYEPVAPTKKERAKNKIEFLSQLRDFQVGRVLILRDFLLTIHLMFAYFQWSHRLPERTLADMLEIMKQGNICDYIRSGEELPHKHTEADSVLRAEVGLSVCMQSQFFIIIFCLLFFVSCV